MRNDIYIWDNKYYFRYTADPFGERLTHRFSFWLSFYLISMMLGLQISQMII